MQEKALGSITRPGPTGSESPCFRKTLAEFKGEVWDRKSKWRRNGKRIGLWSDSLIWIHRCAAD